MIEEVGDRVGVEIAELQRCDLPGTPLSGELEQQLERIAVGAHGVPARPTLTRQILEEEGFDERE